MRKRETEVSWVGYEGKYIGGCGDQEDEEEAQAY